MCLGATAGAYILTLFAVGVSSKDVFYIMLIYKKKIIEPCTPFAGKVQRACTRSYTCFTSM